MERIKPLSSAQNPAIKQLLALKEKARERRKTGRFVLEGVRELALALGAGYRMVSVFFCPDILPVQAVSEILGSGPTPPEIFSVTRELYAKIAHRTSTEGLLAICLVQDHGLDRLALDHQNPLLLIAEAPEKPGNIGALLRTADAAGLDAVIIANPRTDLYNPNIIRSSVGCVFTVPIAMGPSAQVRDFLNQRAIPFYCASPAAAQRYDHIDYTGASAIVVGTEADGLEPQWLREASGNVAIPMAGAIDSMNVSVSAAILIFEAKRQRGFPKP